MERCDDPLRVGISTTVPLEPFLASDKVPVDLNNLFISSSSPNTMVEDAQVEGYPRNICTWIKGLYTASEKLGSVIGVVRGDCSNTESLLETLDRKGKNTHPFSYPLNKNREDMYLEMERLCEFLGTDMESAAGKADELEELRKLAREVDRIKWKEGTISSEDAHLAQVTSSDLNSDPPGWEIWLHSMIEGMNESEGIRLGYIGVPPIITDLFPLLEKLGGDAVFFEVQRQFTMPSGASDWIQRYLDYTYPYGIKQRIKDIKEEIGRRDIRGILHYTQSFCHRQIDDMIFRKELDVPLLTI
ncbi:MAG: 2-hydroxyacyl-CoA dehydratase, partial [Candidatus Thermoplasmatota archaeon]|nr:2-hydroxyacyl-CoA dehydratase [Candidatus Thermoplasmatota archaeon]